MGNEKRNVNVVALLIASLTVGAGVLLLLDPRPLPKQRASPLAITSGGRVESLTITYAIAGTINAASFDAVIGPGDEWACADQLGEGVHMLVAAGPDGVLSEVQQQRLLAVIYDLYRFYHLSLDRILLEPQPDAPESSAAAVGRAQLRGLLLDRRLIQ